MNGYFSRIRVREHHGLNLGLVRRLSEGYGLHQSLWQLFSERGDEVRDFLYRQVEEPALAFYTVSQREPKTQDPLWQVETKIYEPRLIQGARLAFSLRANATRSTKDRVTGKEHRHDVVLHARRKGEATADPEGLHQAGLAWLEERSDKGGFRVEQLYVECHRQHRLFPKGKPPIRFSTLDLAGILEVQDPEPFRQTLFQGLGRSKGFGCGLLLVRPL